MDSLRYSLCRPRRHALHWALAVAVAVGLCGCDHREVLISDADSLRAAEAIGLLASHDISFTRQKSQNGWELAVSSHDIPAALSLLTSKGLIERQQDSDADSSPGLLPSRYERMLAVERQLSRQLEHTLTKLPHVLESRVHIVRPTSDVYGRQTGPKPSGAVLLVTDAPDGVDVDAVKRIVAGAAGIDPGAITTVTVPASGPRGVPSSDETSQPPSSATQALSPAVGTEGYSLQTITAHGITQWGAAVLGVSFGLAVLFRGRFRQKLRRPDLLSPMPYHALSDAAVAPLDQHAKGM